METQRKDVKNLLYSRRLLMMMIIIIIIIIISGPPHFSCVGIFTVKRASFLVCVEFGRSKSSGLGVIESAWASPIGLGSVACHLEKSALPYGLPKSIWSFYVKRHWRT